MMKAYWRVTLQLVVVFGISQSFVINPTRNGRINCDRNANHNYQHHEHFGSAWDDFGDGDENCAADWSRLAARTDVRIFLTQRAIQSFVFLLKSCGDPHTVRWLESNYELTNMENFHGTGAFNLTKWNSWESILIDMLMRPNEVLIIRLVIGQQRQGSHNGRRKNPYLQGGRYVDIEIPINPASLVTRITSVRQQIANEWLLDLDTIAEANALILSSYRENQIAAREESDADNNQLKDIDGIGDQDFVAPYSAKRKMDNAFERKALTLISSVMDATIRESSPFRKSNFDLMLLLLTQESIHRVMRQYQEAGGENQILFAWLRDFYVDRVADYFDGHQKYGRADDFLEELLLLPPSVQSIQGRINLIDPLRIAEDIICMRSRVVSDWKNLIASVPDDHMELRRIMLGRSLGEFPETLEASPPTSDSSPPSTEMWGTGFE